MSEPSVARVVGERLREAGVRYVTGHPGGEVVDLIEGFRQAGLEFVLTRHEAAAAFMADAMASASGIPGVCVATLGPGATNLVTGVAQAHLDRSPLIAFTGQLPADRFEITTHQKLELRALFAPISKWQARLTARNASDVIARALRESLRPRRGPVFVEVPSDVPRQPASNAVASRPHYVPPGAPDTSAVVEPAHAGRAARLLRESRRPLLLVGMDANDEAVSAPLLHLAEEWNIPVMVSPKAKGVFREDHPLFLGTIEMLGTAKLYEFIDSCDLVLMVGFDPVEFDSAWTAPAKVIHIGPLPNNDGYYGSEAELVGPVPDGIGVLRSVAGTPEPRFAGDGEIARLRSTFRTYVAPKRTGLTAQQVLAELRAVLPEDALVTCDVGYNKAVTGQCFPAYRPKTFFMSNGLSSMGYGLPAALGLKLLHRDRTVACVLGDGGFAMLMGELETGVRLGLGVTVIVLADEALSQIRAGQERKGFPVTGTTFGALDYVAIAKGFGIAGYDVRSVRECSDALRSASADAPTLIAAHVDPSAYQLG